MCGADVPTHTETQRVAAKNRKQAETSTADRGEREQSIIERGL